MEKDDHDLLIRVDTNVKTLCKKFDNLATIVEKQQEKYATQVETCNKKFEGKVGNIMFRWVIGLLVVVMVGGAGMFTTLKVDVGKLQVALEAHEEWGKLRNTELENACNKAKNPKRKVHPPQ
jgi:hypothetical protein